MNNMVKKKTLILYYSLCLFCLFSFKILFQGQIISRSLFRTFNNLKFRIEQQQEGMVTSGKTVGLLEWDWCTGRTGWQTEPCTYKSLEYHERRLICGGVSLAELIIQMYIKNLNKCECDCCLQHEDVEQYWFQNTFNKRLSYWNILMIKQ